MAMRRVATAWMIQSSLRGLMRSLTDVSRLKRPCSRRRPLTRREEPAAIERRQKPSSPIQRVPILAAPDRLLLTPASLIPSQSSAPFMLSVRKAAVLLMSLPEDEAAQVLAKLEPKQVRL